MLELIGEHRASIESLCRKHRVVRLELFGSAARGDFVSEASDLDFFVTFEELGWAGASDRYFGLLHGLEDLLGRRIDLIERSAVTNAIFLEVADHHRELLYAAPVAKAS
jgi:hypothetical protein